MGKNYDTDAELRTIDMWVCKTCGRSWPVKGKQPNWTAADAEKAARTCCSRNSPCHICGTRRTEYPHRPCRVCHAEEQQRRWEACEVRPLEFPLTTQDDDRWFYDEDDLAEYCEEHETTPDRLLLRIGKRVELRPFDALDFWQDDTPEDYYVKAKEELEELTEKINAWAKQHIITYRMGPFRPDLRSIQE